MERSTTRIDQDHDVEVRVMNSTSETEQYMRTYPQTMPGTHRLAYEWSRTPKGGHVLKTWPEKLPEAKGDAPADSTGSQPVPLEKLSLPDLQTKAAELGIDLPPKANKSAIVAAIKEKLATASTAV